LGNPREPWDSLGPSFRGAAEASGDTQIRMDSVWIPYGYVAHFSPRPFLAFLRTTRFFFGKDYFPWENLRMTPERLQSTSLYCSVAVRPTE